MATSFDKKLIELLKTDSRFVDDEDELVKAAVIDRAEYDSIKYSNTSHLQELTIGELSETYSTTLGMNPKKLGSLVDHKLEPWKLPLPQFIEKC